MKSSTEINRLPATYNAGAKSAARAISRIEFQRVLEETKAQSAPSRSATKPAALGMRSAPAPQSGTAARASEQRSTTTTTATAVTKAIPVAQPADTVNPYFAERFVYVKPGDTLVGIAQKTLQAQGLDTNPESAMRAALQLAKENGLTNANLIISGQRITVNSLTGSRPPPALASINAGTSRIEVANKILTHSPGSETKPEPAGPQKFIHPILDKTLDRAVSMQYIRPEEKNAVRSKIMDLAAEHHFSPDDLAVVTLIESDGMNPKASNGRCHGVIQFCDGSGAVSVGFKNNPRAILDLPLLDQLDLVGKYFEDTGLKSFGKSKQPASLDDLYLTVLTPAARRERNINAYLDIAGQQANVLKTDGAPNAPITRKSLLQGLRQHARDKLAITIPETQPVKFSSTNILQGANNNTSLIKVSSINESDINYVP